MRRSFFRSRHPPIAVASTATMLTEPVMITLASDDGLRCHGPGA
jgi:hypothetical protein